MGPTKLITTAAVLASGSVLTAPQCAANYDEFAPNGTYSVVSNGEWASMNDRFEDKPTVRSTWNVTSTCSTAFTCSGKVTSSLGWTNFDDGIVGLAGTASGIIGIYNQWKKTA